METKIIVEKLERLRQEWLSEEDEEKRKVIEFQGRALKLALGYKIKKNEATLDDELYEIAKNIFK